MRNSARIGIEPPVPANRRLAPFVPKCIQRLVQHRAAHRHRDGSGAAQGGKLHTAIGRQLGTDVIPQGSADGFGVLVGDQAITDLGVGPCRGSPT